MFDTLITGAVVLTMDDAHTVRRNCCVGITGKTITYVGEALPEENAVQTLDASGMILMPGLINAHGHTAMALLRGYADDHNLQDWLTQYIFPIEAGLSDEDIALGTKLGYLESLAAGITSITEMYLHTPVIAKAAAETGIRSNICNAFVRGENDENFEDGSVCLRETTENLSHPQDTDGRVVIEIGIHAPYTSKPRDWVRIADFAKEHGLRMQCHLSETKTEQEQCLSLYGKTPAALFSGAGVFDVPTSAAHGVKLTNEDMEILAHHKVCVAHNPVSNLKLASGIAPVAEMIRHGLTVAIGTDGAASNNSLDLFEEAKIAAVLQKGATGDPTVLPAEEILTMLTVNGAISQGREEQVGRILPGMEADLILVSPEAPHMQPLYHPAGQIVYCANGSDVRLTMVQGKILYRDGEYMTLDKEQILFHAAAFAEKHL